MPRITGITNCFGVALICLLTQSCGSGERTLRLGPVGFSRSPIQFTIVATAGKGGRIVPADSIKVKQGDDVVFRFIPEETFTIDNVVIDDSIDVGKPQEYRFEDVDSDHKIEVFFRDSSTTR